MIQTGQNSNITPVVLVVDDVAKNLQVVGNILVENKIKPMFSTNGQHALQYLEENKPDLILLDISMPEMDGFEVCEKLKANNKTANIPVIFLTARTQPEEIVKGFELGAVDYVTKPFNKGELLSRVNTHLKLQTALNTIQEQNNQLTKLNKFKDRILSIVGHDLYGPIGSFASLIDIVLNEPDNIENQNQILQILKDTAINSFEFLDNLLHWARSLRSDYPVNKSEIIVYQAINKIINLQSINAYKKQITIKLQNTDDFIAEINPDILNIVLRNILSNAIKFTHKNGKITISYSKINNEFILISINDNGKGISESNLNKIFDPNEIVATYGTNNEKGSGLGLKICKEFIEKSGGKIWVETIENQGSTFYFTIPAKQ